MKQSTRIVINTVSTFTHNLFSIFVSLFSARWVLEALGQSDYGLYGVVGSLILLITFLNGGLTNGVSRFYAFSIGRGENEEKEEAIDNLKHWFNTAFSIHLLLPFILIIIGWPLGEYAIRNWLTIPPDRIYACVWVLRIAFFSAFMSVFSVPFTAMYTAHQLISELAIFGIIRSSFVFVTAWLLLRIESDRLIAYALLLMIINVGIPIVQIVRAMIKFKSCRIKLSYMFDKSYIKELFGFVGWKTFGMSCVVIRNQGTPVMVNLYYGPLVNAAYSIANRISTQASSLSTAMLGAFQPALVSAEGSGNRNKMITMSLQVSKFSSLLVLFFIIPLFIEMQSVLELWLKTPPKYTKELCQWILAIMVVDKMTSGSMLAVNAYGKIAKYEIIQGTFFLISLPLMWLFFRNGFSPVSLGYALFIPTFFYCIGRLLFSKYLLEFPIYRWVKQVGIPIIILTFISAFSGYLVVYTIDKNIYRIIVTSFVTFVFTGTISWLFILSKTEKAVLRKMIRKALIRFFPVFILLSFTLREYLFNLSIYNWS